MMRNLLLSKKIGLFLIVLVGLLVGAGNKSIAQSPYTSEATGNWNSDATWSGTGIPGAGDAVFINHVVTITSGTEAYANTITINSTGKLIIEGNLTMAGSLTMDFSGQDESELVLSAGSKVIVKGDVSLSNKTSVNISSYFVVLGSFTKIGSANKGDLTITTAHIYLLGDVTTPWKNFSNTGCSYNGTTNTIDATCDYGTLDDLIINDVASVVPGVAEIITTAILQSKPTAKPNLSSSSNCFCSGGSSILTIAEDGTISLLRWYVGTNSISNINSPSKPYTYSINQAGSYYALYKVGTLWYQTNSVTVTSSAPPTATISGTATICAGSSTQLSIALGGDGPWNFTYTDGTTPVTITNRATSPYITDINPSATKTYTLTSVNNSCCTGTTSGIAEITVNTANTAGAASSTPTVCVNTALTAITHTTTGATGIGTATDLPDGVTAAWASNTITISGTPIVSGTFNYSIPLTGGCGTMNATGTIAVNALPTAFNVSGGGIYCSGGSGVSVGLSGSQNGMNYQLYNGATLVGSPVSGTGSAISFGSLPEGTYTVMATLTSGDCPVPMNGTAIVTVGDNVPPVITKYLPNGTADCVKNLPSGIESIQDFITAGGEVSDNCTALNNLIITFADVIDPGTTCKVTRTYTIKDLSDNIATCMQVFTITDTKAPVINSVVDLRVSPNDNSCGANLTIAAPDDITEACSLVVLGARYEYIIAGTTKIGNGIITDVFPEGTTLITWTVADVCGHVSDPIIQSVQVGINLTAISYDNGSTETGSGSGVKPVLTSTHKYIVDGEIAETGFTYQWKIYTDANGNGSIDGSDVEVSTGFTMSPGNDRAEVDITFNNLTENVNYILSVIKTKNSTTCEKQKTLPVTIQANTFDTELKLFGNNCQSGETNTPSTILWEVDFVGNGVAPYSFGYAVTLDGTPICSGTVLNITLTGTNPTHSSGCDNSSMPYMRVVKTATDSYKVRLEYTLSSITAHNFQVSIQISNATDRFTVTQIETNNNSETLQLWGVPNTSAITTD